MVNGFKIIYIILSIVLITSCSSYYGKKDDSGRFRINEKHWTLKNLPNEGVKRVVETEAWYRLEYYFTNDDFSFTDQKENTYKNNSSMLWFFKSGHVLKFVPYAIDDKKIEQIKNYETSLNFGTHGFYTIGSNEFEIEFFQEHNVPFFGSMDRYYYQALIEGDTLHLVRRHHQKGLYVHSIYIKESMPEALKNQKANW